jgi:glutaminase
VRSAEAKAALAPVQDYLSELHARVSSVTGGKPADYIPELGKANSNLFGIAIATVDGQIYAVGDAEVPFTIQSVSKPFTYGYALQRYGRRGAESCRRRAHRRGLHSIVLDEVMNRPFNPMVNAGAIAVAELMDDENQEARVANMLGLCSSLAGRKLDIDEAVFGSELSTAIAIGQSPTLC